MNCDDVKELLQDYVTRELDPDRRKFVDEHLLECDECRRELALVSVVVSSLDTIPVLEPSADFSRNVMAALPRRRMFVPNPSWALILAPILAGLAWLFRAQLLSGLLSLLRRCGVDPSAFSIPASVRLPAVSTAQLGLAVAVLTVLGLGLAIGTAVWCWQRYVRD